ncbi:MAG: helix-turn-helix transcriptional regulator [Elusimicrobiota bacterium]
MTEEIPFGRMVRERMRTRGTGLRELCRSVGVDPSFFSKVLTSKRSPPAEEETLRRVARALEMDETRLIVAAGRVPTEWHRLWTDDELFSSVHAMASGMKPGMRIPAEVLRPKARVVLPAPRKDLEEELL